MSWQGSGVRRLARGISAGLHPMTCTVVLMLFVLLRSQRAAEGALLGWVALIVGVGGFLPLLIMLGRSAMEARQSGTPVSLRRLIRRDLREIYALTAGNGALTFGLLLWLRAPRTLVATLLAMVAVVLAIAGLNRLYRASFHMGLLASACTLGVLVFGAPAVPGFAVLIPVGWARHYLKQHTPLQMLVGGALGVMVAAGTWVGALLALGGRVTLPV